MSQFRMLMLSITSWVLIVMATLAVRFTLSGTSMSLAEGLAWIFLSLSPIAVLLAIARGAASTVTIAQVLYNTENIVASPIAGREDRP